jgi:peptidoglycan-associated lipoprotein
MTMTNTSFRNHKLMLTASALLALAFFGAACGGKKTIPAPPPAPSGNTAAPTPTTSAPGAPTATLTAEPSSIQIGQSATLSWTTSNASEITISNGIGTVAASGRQTVSPTETTTYNLAAIGSNGTATARATVTIAPPPPPPNDVPVRPSNGAGTFESRVQSDLKDAFFDYDAVNIREDAHAALLADADALKRIFMDFPNATINVEGHCDERGSAEYNLGLGDRRASEAKNVLVQLGVPADRLRTISYGKERPQCTEADETCYQKNRRAHFSAGQ